MKTVSRHYGQPHIMVDSHSQLKLVQNFSIERKHDSHQVSKFAGVVSTFVSILTNFGYEGDLNSTSNINMILNKFPQHLNRKEMLKTKYGSAN